MPYTTGTISSAFGASGLMRTLVDWCTGSPGTPGLDWTIELDENTTDEPSPVETEPFGSTCKQVILKNVGISTSESILIGIREWQYPAGNAYGWDLNGYLTYTTGQHWNISKAIHGRSSYNYTWEHYTTHPVLSINDDTMTYWFYSNAQRICGAVKIGGRYFTFYLGFGRRFGAPSDYQYPLVIVGSTTANYIWSDSLVQLKYCIRPYYAGGSSTYITSFVVAPDNTFKYSLANVQDLCFFLPADFWNNTGQQTASSNDLYPMHPVYLVTNISPQCLMDLDGVYMVTGTGLLPEDTLLYGGKRFRVFPNVYRLTYSDFLAMQEVEVHTTTTTTTSTSTTTTSSTTTTTTSTSTTTTTT